MVCHFKELASSSFETPILFNGGVAKVIAASREDSNLDEQLSIAEVFTLLVFRGGAKGSGRTASSGQGSSAPSASSLVFGKGQALEFRWVKCKASPSPSRPRQEKSPCRGSSPSAKWKGSRKWVVAPCPAVIGGCLSLHLRSWRDIGAESWVVEVLR